MFFYSLSGIAILSAASVLACNNPVKSALSLVVHLFTIAFLYFNLEAYMLGVTQIMVYVGAIMVLFLFVLMLLDPTIKQINKTSAFCFQNVASVAILVFLCIITILSLEPIFYDIYLKESQDFGTPQTLGLTLFSKYIIPFEIASVLLLVGVVGSILLARRKS